MSEDLFSSAEGDDMEMDMMPADAEARKPRRTLLIIDGYSLVYRCYYAHASRPLTDREGRNISAYYGFFSSLMMILSEHSADYLAVAMDERHPTFRHEMYPEYKATRPPAPEDLHAQIPLIRETLGHVGISIVSRQGFEADDIIASLAKKAGENGIDTAIVTSDKDLMQLVSDRVYVLRPSPKKAGNGYLEYREKEVEAEYGVKPEQMVDYLTILGDTADNVPGIKGLGEKGAVKLLAEYVTLDGIYRHLGSLPASVRSKLEAGRESAELSRRLIVLSRDAIADDFDLESLSVSHLDFTRGGDDFTKHGCMTLAKRAGSVVLAEKEEPREEIHAEYSVSRDLAGARADFERISQAGSLMAIAFDCSSVKYNAQLTGFAYSYEKGKAVYVPVNAWDAGDVCRLFADYLGTGKIKPAVHDAKTAIHALRNMGVELNAIRLDTMIASWMVDSGGGWYDIDSVWRRVIEGRDDPPKKAKNLSDEENMLLIASYADKTLQLAEHLEPLLDGQGFRELYSSMEEPLIRVLASMEREGMHISMGAIREMDAELTEKIDALTKEIHQLAGHEFNISSTMQLGKVLYEEKGLPRPGGKSSSVRAEVLQNLLPKGGRLIEAILEYRNWSTLRNTFTKPMQSMADSRSRIHTTFLQTGTATGRLSSRDPNLQNIPIRTEEGRRIRDAFTPKEGTVFISADYSQIELVVLAHITQDRWLMDAFRNGLDVHRYTAGMIFSKPLEDVTPAERRIAKTINFGIIYGMSAYGVSSDLGISRSEAADFRRRYLERYTGIQDFIERTEKLAKETGYVSTMHGHRRRIESAAASSRNASAEADRMAVNTVIQGSAAEIVKKAMLSVFRAIEERGLRTRLLLQVHDELIFESPIEEKEEAKALIKELMENAEQLSVPLHVSVEEGQCWGAMH